MDTRISPCRDFYLFASGTWLANNPIPADRASWGAGSELQEQNIKVLKEILDEAAADRGAPAGSVKAKVGEFYRVGMDEARIEKDGGKPLDSDLARIAAIADAESLAREIARLHRAGTGTAFGFFVAQDAKNSVENIAQLYQGGLGLPDRDYYLSDDPHMKEVRAKYQAHVQKMFELAGDAPAAAAANAKTVLALETRLARKSMTPVEQRDPNAIYHRMSAAELARRAPGFAWPVYFAGVGLSGPTATNALNVAQPEFFEELGAMAKDVPLKDWKTYLRWDAIHGAAPYLSSPFVNENFAFFGRELYGQKEPRVRWKRVLGAVDGELGEALGQLYVARAFPPEAKAKALDMVMNLKAALGDRIRTLDWIGEDTRKQALRKLDAIVVKIGYPDKWRDYSALRVDAGSYLGNVRQAEEFEFQRNLNKIGRPLDRTEWGITTPTVDAYYNPTLNEIVFPAGILQPPFFDPKADDASNYGSIGGVIGHELTHGFDDEGRQFDAEGNLKNWWTDADVRNYQERGKAIARQYSGYVAVDDLHINGELTLGENIADIGGLKIAYLALQKSLAGKPAPEKIDGFTPDQRFFIAYAQGWRRNATPESLRVQIATDPHSPAPFRVRGPTADTPEFSRAFACGVSGGGGGDGGGGASAQIW
ncbi:MAG TPA: M13 family metallopeptidase [Thermoanaerobaculia bacterium]